VTARTAITYHQLQTFLAVARSGNLTKVARELNATQPTVSLQLRTLAKSVGLPLFERPGGRFRLTPAGERLRRYAEEALEALREFQQDVAVLKGSLTGSLAVGVTFFAVSRLLPQALPRFRARFPGVDLHVHVDRPEPLFNQLAANALDIACYVKVRTPPDLVVESVGHEELVIIASPQHPLAGRSRISAEELSEQRLVVSHVSVFRELVEAKLRAIGVTPRTVTEARNYDAVNELVDGNVGYALHIKTIVAGEIAAGRFVALRVECPPILEEIVVAYRPRASGSPLVQELVRFLRAELTHASKRNAPKRSARPSRRRRAARAGRPRSAR
jgi:DNA-binding transcriptional LysR family regulator